MSMPTPTPTGPQDKKPTDHHLMMGEMELLTQLDSTVSSMMSQLQRENELRQRNAIVERMIQVMHDGGASNRSIQKALPGLAEFARFAIKKDAHPASDEPRNHDAPSDPGTEMLGLFLSQVETREIHWLWEKHIPLGKITVLDGDPGMGKSLLAINLAARVSTGQPMPDGTPGKQGGVILIAPEDGAHDTLRPRLEAAGGDPSHVLLLNMVEDLDTHKRKVNDRPFSLARDLEVLTEAIKRTNALLVILDPLMAVLGHSIDSSRDQDVREVFTPLAQLAERTHCAILIIRHLSKGLSGNALYRGAGSIGIIAAARIGLLVAPHPFDVNKRILTAVKNNLSKPASNLSYEVLENESGIPYIHWLAENNYMPSTLLDDTTYLSIERQRILQVLQDSAEPLGPYEVAKLTGQKYASVRLILSRMHESSKIVRLSRGKYTTLHHPSLLQNHINDTAKTSATTDTSDTLDTLDTMDTIYQNP
jgi:archaellum biogenesis ATPase FlaH